MIFIPFTVVDNRNNVVVGAALVNKENIDIYKWVLEAFLKAHQKQPTFVLTDHCPTMKQVIAAVFPYTRHRLCMWHITNKLPNKVNKLKKVVAYFCFINNVHIHIKKHTLLFESINKFIL